MNAPRLGKLAAPRYVVKVVVTEFKEGVQGRSQGDQVHSGPLFSIIGSVVGGNAGKVMGGVGALDPNISHGTETIEGVVGLEVRLVDIERGVVIGQTRALGKLTRKNSRTVLGVAGISTSDARFSESVLGQATRAAVEDATVQLHTLLRGRSALAVGSDRRMP
jgi:curli biogenesis system outer membrane secretion channel CsgG